MKKTVKILALLLALVLLVTVFAACKDESEGEGGENETGKLITGENNGPNGDPYAGVDFGGRCFNIHLNKNESGYSTSSTYIASVEQLNAQNTSCEQAVYERDAWMRENLNMDVEYTIYDAPYGSVAEKLRIQIVSGNEYDLYIDKLYPMANLSLEGSFKNIANRMELQYFEPYWYNDYMTSLSLDEGNSMYLLAGDFFMDVLRSSHVMFVNLDMFDNYFSSEGGSAAFLEEVIAGNWTYETLLRYSNAVYTEGSSVHDTTYGLLLHTVWEPLIPMLISGGTNFAEKDSSGRLVPTVNSERNSDFFDILNALIYSDGANTCTRNMANDLGLNPEFGVEASVNGILDLFIRNRGLFAYGRFASMEKLGQSDMRYSVVPYPKFIAEEEYITSSHDTTEIGAIPNNVTDDGVVLEMLNIMSDLTNQDLMQIYYEETLKLRYSADETVAAIVDIVHEHMGSAFALAYNDACNTSLLWNPFYVPLRDGRNFLANYPSVKHSLESGLKSLMDKWNEIS